MKAWGPCGAMVLVQLAYAGSIILTGIAMDKGLNQFVLMVYRHIIAMLLLGPFAYVLERTQRPSLSFSVMMKIFVLSSLGTTICLNVYYAGLAYTSATVASALSNGIPSFTFLMAVLFRVIRFLLFRMEELRIQSARGRAKVLGTMVCIGGSLTFTFWKGGHLFNGFTERPLINVHSTKGSASELNHGVKNWIKGSALILISNIAWCLWVILQAVVCKLYPARLSLNALMCFFASLQSSFVALIFARNPAFWKLEWNVQLWTIIYCGVVGSGLVNYLQTWCISKKGPVFSAMFTPLVVVIVGIFSAVAFAERLHLGSLIGAFLIIAGLYIVLWGKQTDGLSEGTSTSENGLHDDKVPEISVNDQPDANPITNERK